MAGTVGGIRGISENSAGRILRGFGGEYSWIVRNRVEEGEEDSHFGDCEKGELRAEQKR